MLQNKLKPAANSKTKRTRLWRWVTGKWKTCWRWHKWQNSRKSGWVKPWFEGWQTPLYRRLPKLKGFNNRGREEFQWINLRDLNIFDWKKVWPKELVEAWLIRSESVSYKILWDWELKAKIEISTYKISATAQKKVEKAWGKVELI